MSTASSAVSKRKKKTGPNAGRVWFWASECKYSVIMDAAKKLGWKLVTEEKQEGSVNIYWIDVATIHERFRSIQPWQMINHFPGMPNIARKNRLGQNLNRMQKIYPKEYGFYPRTWVLPTELSDFRNQFDNHGIALANKIFIIKPDAGCQGRGIFLTRTYDNVPTTENVVAQVYIKKPLLIDGFKFDLRIYCLVTSVKPLRMYLFQDGLVRLCTERYVKPTKQNLDNACMHLTNYAVNKYNANFHQPDAKTSDEPQDDSSKRALAWFMTHIKEKYGEARAKSMWTRIGTLCVRTVLSIMPTLSREYDQHFKEFDGIPLKPPVAEPEGPVVNKSEDDEEEEGKGATAELPAEQGPLPSTRGCRCFEILGLDIMIDSALRPTLIEVNHLPSFGTDSPLDLDIKRRLMEQVLPSLSVQADDEQAFLAYQKQEAERRLNSERKGREKELEREKERLQQEERERQERRRKWRQKELERAARLRQQIAEAAAKAAEAAILAQQREEAVDELCTPERLQEIKDVLRKLYEEYSPEKVAKIDKLLSKYQGREEEFLRFALQKYCPTFLLDIAVKQIVQNDEAERMKEAEQEAEQEGVDVAEVLDDKQREVAAASNAYSETDRQLVTYSDKKLVQVKPPSKPFNVAKSTFGTGRSARSLSPSREMQQRRAGGLNWKDIGAGVDQVEDASMRAKLIAQYVPSMEDEWMKFEMRHLTQFTRIFPLSTEDKGVKGEVVEEDTYEDVGQDDDAEEDAAGTNQLSEEQAQAKKKENKFIPASFEDILIQVFTQDKRQFMRLHGPIAARSSSLDDKNDKSSRDSQSLPPLNHKTGSNSSGKVTKIVDAKDAKASLQSQLDAADRLSRGMAAYRASNTSDSVAKAIAQQQIQEEQQQVSDGTDASAAGVAAMQYKFPLNSGLFSNQRINRLMEDSRLAHQRFDQAKLSPPIMLPVNSVRQQQFHFDLAQNTTETIARPDDLVIQGARNAGMQSGDRESPHAVTNSIGAGIVGRSVTRTMKPRLSESETAAADATRRSIGAVKRLTVPSEERAQEVALRNLFPGFF